MNRNEALTEYCIRIGDNAVVLSQRLSEWLGHAPILEEDIALSNMALDLIGQAKGFYTYAAQLEGKGRTEDYYAFHRSEREYHNRQLVEQPNGDFGVTIMRSFLFSSAFYLQLRELVTSSDETISGLAEKALKEVTYHVRHCSEWIIRLGDGTDESKRRIQQAAEDLWQFTDELFETDDVDATLLAETKLITDNASCKTEWLEMIAEIFQEATLTVPVSAYQSKGGIKGIHTEHLGHLLAEMQFLPRAYPDATW